MAATPLDRPSVVGLSPEGADRTRRAVEYVEQSLVQGGSSGRGRWGAPRRPGKRYARVTTAITARSGTTLGQGLVTLYTRSDAALTPSTTETGLTCYNSTIQTAGLTVDSVIQVAWVDGAWAVDVADCS